jgi:predicted acylesterase/phospholipase RssA
MTARISRRHSLVVVPSILAATHQHHHHRCWSSSVSSSSSTTTSPSLTFAPITSFGFSGGGFLASYHLGAAHLLVQQGWLLKPGQVPPPTHTNTSHNHDHHHHIHRDPRNMIITGVSAGSLVVAAVAAGTNLEQGGLEACQLIAQRAKQMGGYLDCLKPGYVHVWLLYVCLILNFVVL